MTTATTNSCARYCRPASGPWFLWAQRKGPCHALLPPAQANQRALPGNPERFPASNMRCSPASNVQCSPASKMWCSPASNMRCYPARALLINGLLGIQPNSASVPCQHTGCVPHAREQPNRCPASAPPPRRTSLLWESTSCCPCCPAHSLSYPPHPHSVPPTPCRTSACMKALFAVL